MYWCQVGTTADTQTPSLGTVRCTQILETTMEEEHGDLGGAEIDSSRCDRDREGNQLMDFVTFSLIVNKSESSQWMKLPRLAGGWRQRFVEMKNILYVWCVGERRNLGRGLNPLLPTGIWWSILVFQSHWNCLFWTLKINCLFML